MSTATSERQAVVAFEQFVHGLKPSRGGHRKLYTGFSPQAPIPATKLSRSEVLRVFLILKPTHEPHRVKLGKVGNKIVHLSDEFWGDAKLRSESIVTAADG